MRERGAGVGSVEKRREEAEMGRGLNSGPGAEGAAGDERETVDQ